MSERIKNKAIIQCEICGATFDKPYVDKKGLICCDCDAPLKEDNSYVRIVDALGVVADLEKQLLNLKKKNETLELGRKVFRNEKRELEGKLADLDESFEACCKGYEMVEEERDKAENKLAAIKQLLEDWEARSVEETQIPTARAVLGSMKFLLEEKHK